jgi:hypothetical protein
MVVTGVAAIQRCTDQASRFRPPSLCLRQEAMAFEIENLLQPYEALRRFRSTPGNWKIMSHYPGIYILLLHGVD